MAKTNLKNNSAKILTLFLIGFIFFSVFSSALADVIINEFVSDPDSGSEWIELLNTSSSEINLSGWNWTELASPGTDTEHESSPKSLSGVVSAGGVFVFEMNSALNNAGDSIGLYNATDIIDRVSFGKVTNYSKDLDLPSKGKSGALISSAWKTNQDPTKGEINPASSGSSDGDSEEENNSEISDTNSSSNGNVTEIKIATQKTKIQIIAKPIAYVGIPFTIQGTGTDTFGEKLSHGRYYWNFGDGDFREVKVINTDKFTHTYFYPGDYSVIFEYYPDSFADVPDAVQKITIKVVAPEISISSVGSEKDFFIELSNNTSHDTDISNWVLLSDYKVFKIPRNTIVQANKKIIISSRITNFSIADKNTLRLLTSEGDIATSYSNFTARKDLAGVQHPTAKKTDSVSNYSEVDDAVNYLPALAGASDTSSPIIPIISAVFIGASASAVYFIRRKKSVLSNSDDFEILDE